MSDDNQGGGGVPFVVGFVGSLTLLDEPDGSASDGVVLLLLVTDAVSASSGMVANFFKTCLSAGRLIGLLGRSG